MTSAALILRAQRMMVSSQPEQEHELGGRGRQRAGHERAGRLGSFGPSRAARLDQPAVDEADEQDEQADARADRSLEATAGWRS